MDTLRDAKQNLVDFIQRHPVRSYFVSIIILWGLGVAAMVMWCNANAGNCFVCEYDFYRESALCGYNVFHVTLVNECHTTIFMGATGPSSVVPRQGNMKWHIAPGESIRIDIPENWKHTQGGHAVGPRFWARTGCKFDIEHDKAQCETGDCGNYYDCSRQNLAGKAPTSLAEFCFVCGDDVTYYDVSLVDGYSVSVDITPGPHSLERPNDPGNPYWCRSQLCNRRVDLRTTCLSSFLMNNTQLSSFNPATDQPAKIACFSNCGKYAYPTAPSITCNDSDPQCAHWRMYCCQSFTYGKPCTKDGDCNDGGACWGGTCQCKAYWRNPNCPPDICTNPGLDAQPIPGPCSGDDCIGDDTLHYTCPRAYTWPNDPQTYSCDATSYTITFCPGGTAERITPPRGIPYCDSLGADFNWEKAKADCSVGHGVFLCAVKGDSRSWGCNVDRSGCNEVICRWAMNRTDT